MNKFLFGAALSLTLSACGQSSNAPQQEAGRNRVAPGVPDAQAYSASGDVTAVSEAGVTISHGPVPDIGWPAMTMTFKTPSPEMAGGINVGDQVNFEFRQAGADAVLTAINKTGQ